MKDKYHIDYIRHLLHKYYEGETTPEEELNLEAFFRDTPEWEIPEDLEEDGRFFASMASLHPCEYDLEIPNGLFERISDFSGSKDAGLTDKLYQVRRIGYILAAACVCLIVTSGILGIRWMTNQKHIHTETSEYTSESHAKLPEPLFKASPEEETSHDTSKIPSESNTRTYQLSDKTAENVGEPNRLEDGFIEITDPVEAEKIVLEIGKLLAANTQKSNEAILHLEKTVDEYKEITKSILR